MNLQKKGYTAIEVDTYFFFTDKGIYVWGRNGGDQFGRSRIETPTLIEALMDKTVQQLIVGDGSVFCLIDQDVYVWGNNHNGMLGLGHVDPVDVPTQVDVFSDKVVQEILFPCDSAFCITDDGVYAWGDNSMGQLGLGHDDDVSTPTRIDVLSGQTVRQLHHYEGAIFCLTDQGVYVWGDTEDLNLSQFGYCYTKERSLIPTKITMLQTEPLVNLLKELESQSHVVKERPLLSASDNTVFTKRVLSGMPSMKEFSMSRSPRNS